MGSGQGKTRRTRASVLTAPVAPPAEVVVSHATWVGFVREQGLSNVKLANYHKIVIPFDQANPSASFPQMIELAKELFRDLVAVDAITLPPGEGVDDFEFDVRNMAQNMWSDYAIISLVVQNSKTKAEESCFRYPGGTLDNDTRMGANKAIEAARGIAAAVQRIYAPRSIKHRAQMVFAEDYRKEQDPEKKQRLRLLAEGWEEKDGLWYPRNDPGNGGHSLESAYASQEQRRWRTPDIK